MIVDLIDKVIGYLSKLIERKDALDGAAYEQIITPAMDALTELHIGYQKSLAEYVDLLSDETLPFDKEHPIFALLEADAIASGPLRAKVQSLELLYTDPKYGRFAFRLTRYLQPDQIVKGLTYGMPRTMNGVRRYIAGGVDKIFAEPIDRSEKVFRIQQITAHLSAMIETNYQKVVDEHLRLRAAALGLKVSAEDLSAADRLAIRYEEKNLADTYGWPRLY